MESLEAKMKVACLLGRQAHAWGVARSAPRELTDDQAKMWLAGWDDANEEEKRYRPD